MMRISDLVEKAMLTEAVNFRTEQVRHILANIQDFRFGIEYEFKIKPEFLGDDDGGETYLDDDDLYGDATNDHVQRWFLDIYKSDLETLVASIIGSNDNKGVELLSAFVGAYNYDDTPEELRTEFQRILNIDGATLKTIADESGEIYSLVSDFMRNISVEIRDMFFDEMIGDAYITEDDFSSALEDISSSMAAIRQDSSFENVYEVVKALSENEALDKIEGVYGALENAIGTIRGNNSMIAIYISRALIETESGRETTDEERYRFAESRARNVGGDGYAALNFIAQHFEDLPWVEGVVEDGSFKPSIGGELVTAPLTFKEMLTRMKEVFAFIDEYGYTDDRTGMHVNISHKRFKTIGKMDLLKMVVLLDPDYMQNEGLGKWKERNDMVKNLYRNLTPRVIQSLAEYYARYGITKVEEQMNRELIQPEKFRSVNFKESFGYANPQTRRIEYRLFGGKNYEARFTDCYMDILFASYTVMAAVDEKFLRREYLEHLIKTLNRYAYTQFQMSFIELARKYDEDYRVGLNQKINKKS